MGADEGGGWGGGGTGAGVEVGDLAEELRATRVEQVEHLRRGDPETARLMGAWINALLDEWNRRRGCSGGSVVEEGLKS
ncbi:MULTISPECIES: hypothetical protein [Actinosynnema]|uniref:hypothetical protein n=1 Tax=Actinosynnema TaxID=40566 RepID=UPI0020A33DB5|nr:hypothetical protein [Actinosynnema pretiosum]